MLLVEIKRVVIKSGLLILELTLVVSIQGEEQIKAQ